MAKKKIAAKQVKRGRPVGAKNKTAAKLKAKGSAEKVTKKFSLEDVIGSLACCEIHLTKIATLLGEFMNQYARNNNTEVYRGEIDTIAKVEKDPNQLEMQTADGGF